MLHHLCEVSCNFSHQCYVLKVDVNGYFMHINRNRLLEICRKRLLPFKHLLDWPLIDFLLQTIVLNNPVSGCIRIGDVSEWERLPDSKSLFHSPEGCGLPIGNLTSQLFSNVYLNELDQYVTHGLGVNHYSRYVDDAFVVSDSMHELRFIASRIGEFLSSQLGLKLNANKTRIDSAYSGVGFLGAYLKPFRKYVNNQCLKHIDKNIRKVKVLDTKHQWSAVNSYLGLSSHYCAYNIRKKWVAGPFKLCYDFGYFSNHLLTLKLTQNR